MNQDKHHDMYVSQGNRMRYQDMHSCVDVETPIYDVQLARAYVPFQKWCLTFAPMASLKNGTAFPGLYDAYGWESQYGYGGRPI